MKTQHEPVCGVSESHKTPSSCLRLSCAWFRYYKATTAWFATLAVFAAVAVQADTATDALTLPPDSPIARYLAGQDAIQHLHDLARVSDAEFGLQQNYQGERNVRLVRGSIVILEQIVMPPDEPHPAQGVWQYKFGFERCGDIKIYNVLAIAAQGQPTRYIGLVPGRTIASPLLMRDTAPMVLMKASFESGLKSGEMCKDTAVVDTSISVPPRPVYVTKNPQFAGSWEETWTVRYCGKTYDVPVCFTPDGKGGTSFAAARCGG